MQIDDNQIELQIELRKRKIAEELNLSQKSSVVSIAEKTDMPLGGNLICQKAYIFGIEKIDGKEREKYYIVLNSKYDKVAYISQDGEITLSEESKKIYSQSIGTEGNQTKLQKQIYDLDEKYYLKDDNNKLKTINEEEQIKEQEETESKIKEIAETTNSEDKDIIGLINIEDKRTFSYIIDKNIDENSELYIVKYKNNQFKVMKKTTDGYNVLKGIEFSELSMKILEETNINTEYWKQNEIKNGVLYVGNSNNEARKNLIGIRNEQYPEKQLILEHDREGRVKDNLLKKEDNNTLSKIDTETEFPGDIILENEEIEIQKVSNERLEMLLKDLYIKELAEKVLELENEKQRIKNEPENSNLTGKVIGNGIAGYATGTAINKTQGLDNDESSLDEFGALVGSAMTIDEDMNDKEELAIEKDEKIQHIENEQTVLLEEIKKTQQHVKKDEKIKTEDNTERQRVLGDIETEKLYRRFQ